MGEWRTRVRHRNGVDRVVRYRTVETSVMGGGAVAWTALVMIPSAIVQGVTQDSSKLLADFGGMRLSIAWSAVMLGAIATILTSRRIPVPRLRARIEGTGTVLLALGYLAYAYAIYAENGWVGSLVVISGFFASGTNMLKRAWMLAQQLYATRKVRKVAKGDA